MGKVVRLVAPVANSEKVSLSLNADVLTICIPVKVVYEKFTPPVDGRNVPRGLLSPTEMRIFNLLRTRLGNKEIASKLNTSVRTVKFHNSNIYRKLRVNDRIGLLKIFGMTAEEGDK